MSDVQISNLPGVNQPVLEADRMIINVNGNTETKQCSVSQLQQIFGSGGGGIIELFSPIVIDKLNAGSIINWSWGDSWGSKAPVTAAQATLTLPAPLPPKANAALIWYSTNSVVETNQNVASYVSNGQYHAQRSYMYHEIQTVSGQFEHLDSATGTKSNSFALQSNHNYTFSPKKANGVWQGNLWQSRLPVHKTALLSGIQGGQTLQFNYACVVGYGGYTNLVTYPGRMSILPLMISDMLAFESMIAPVAGQLFGGGDGGFHATPYAGYVAGDQVIDYMFPDILQDTQAALGTSADFIRTSINSANQNIAVALSYYNQDPVTNSGIITDLTTASNDLANLRTDTADAGDLIDKVEAINTSIDSYVNYQFAFESRPPTGPNPFAI